MTLDSFAQNLGIEYTLLSAILLDVHCHQFKMTIINPQLKPSMTIRGRLRREGLLPAPKRVSGHRRYNPDVLKRLGLIQLLRQASFGKLIQTFDYCPN